MVSEVVEVKRDPVRRAIHAFTHNEAASTYLIPAVKALLCVRYCNFGRLSPAFDLAARRDQVHEFRFSGQEKILVCGLPKSGNSWLSQLLAEYFSLSQIHPFFDRAKAGVAMNHFPPGIDILYRRDIVLCFYILRDIREVVCSYFHYAKTPYYWTYIDSNYNPASGIEEFYFGYFLRQVVPRYKWLENARVYKALGVPLVHYRDLLRDTEREFRRLLNEVGVTVDDAKLRKAIDLASFARLKETGVAVPHSSFFGVQPLPPSHFRRGEASVWQDELPPIVVQDIEQRFGSYLQEWGYDLSSGI